ncbi:MAG TPA: 4Fe-4S binding protein [Planctomycetes bacterium]|nr:4Fe-4S binding protein [Planctomycetota bacterium]
MPAPVRHRRRQEMVDSNRGVTVPVNNLLRKWYFPLAVQVLFLIVFILLILGGLVANTEDMGFAKELRNTNLANLIVWSYWWPVIILSAIVLGRVWCMVCPMELVTSLAARIGWKRQAPRWLTSGWVITLFYVLILFVGIHTLAIHRVPYRMALYMLVLLAVGVLAGLIFSRNAFCAYICPVGHLLGLYARLAPLGWRVRKPKVCEACEDHSCIASKTAYRFQGRSCGVGLNPARLDDNTVCLLCGQCLKACDQNNPGIEGRPNPGWFPRPWFKDLLALRPLTGAQAAFCVIVSGFVLYEILTEWSVTKAWLTWAPAQLEAAVGAVGIWSQGLTKSLTLFVALPLLIWLIPYALFRITGGRMALKDYLLRFGLAFVPIMAAMHALKALLKTTSRIPYWQYTLGDPAGVRTAEGLIGGSVRLSALPAWCDPALDLLSLGLLVAGVALSAVVVRKLVTRAGVGRSGHGAVFYLIPLIYGGIFGGMLIAWRWL